jgi:hypothetical protein
MTVRAAREMQVTRSGSRVADTAIVTGYRRAPPSI